MPLSNAGIECTYCKWSVDVTETHVAYDDPPQVKLLSIRQIVWAIDLFAYFMDPDDVPS